MRILFLMFFISCSAQQIKNKSPERPHDRRFYRFSDEQFIFYNRDCKRIKEPRNENCEMLLKDSKDIDTWNWFKNRDFIIIPFDMIF